ncbi:hypothetical protein BBJ28_00020825 [Nothophytophthora sp. Chile5]|nr:hypothetical protein BBJ28_00020825 [Nothophytophthora sp. Chile5]
MISNAPRPMAPYVMRLELRPPVDAELAVSALAADEDVDDAFEADETVEVSVEEDDVDVEVVEPEPELVLQESAVGEAKQAISG